MIDRLSIEGLALERGGRRLIAGFNLELRAGEAATLVGPNGVGKTSLLRAVAGLAPVAAGAIRFGEGGGWIEAEDARRDGLHLLGHADGLKSSRRAGDELAFAVAWLGGSAGDAGRAAGMLGVGPLLDERVRRLSAGQRRRLALARLLAARRELWLLDEPLAPLDAAGRVALGQAMAEHLARGGLILAASHDPLPVRSPRIELRR